MTACAVVFAAVAGFLAWRNLGSGPAGDHGVLPQTHRPPTRQSQSADESQSARTTPPPATADGANPEVTETKERILATLHEASITYDPKELPGIWKYLLHADAEIRGAARNGMIVLGDASAGPMLREASKQAPTPQEAVGLLEAADYVELPSGTFEIKRHPSANAVPRPFGRQPNRTAPPK